MAYEHVLAAFYSTPLALLPAKLEEVRAVLHLRAKGEKVPDEDVRRVVSGRRSRVLAGRQGDGIGGGGVQMVGRVAVVPVFGMIAQRVGMLDQASGGVSTEAIGNTIDRLAADRQVKSICLCFDSPGGAVPGVPELGDKIRGYRGKKTIVGVADAFAASAAYWLLSQCVEINVTPSGQVGSIGVLADHEDHSARLENEGVKTTVVTAGKYKGEGSPYGPLDDEARAELQAKVDHYYGMFLDAVAAGRGTTAARVRRDFGQGRMVTAADAVRLGMADRVASLETVLRRLGSDDKATPGSRGTASDLEARLSSYAATARAVAVEQDLADDADRAAARHAGPAPAPPARTVEERLRSYRQRVAEVTEEERRPGTPRRAPRHGTPYRNNRAAAFWDSWEFFA